MGRLQAGGDISQNSPRMCLTSSSAWGEEEVCGEEERDEGRESDRGKETKREGGCWKEKKWKSVTKGLRLRER